MNKEFIIKSLNEMIPNPKCELNYTSDYTLLIAILLSAQTLDKNVNKITPILFNKFPTLKALKDASLNELTQIIHPLGLANNKAKSIKELATILVDKYDSKIPMDRNVLTTLPGIGIKTSGVFLVEFASYNYLPVDTHVKRVSSRLGIIDINMSISQIEETLSSFFEYNNLGHIHQLLVLFGRYICKSQSPDCNNCKFKGKCCLTR